MLLKTAAGWLGALAALHAANPFQPQIAPNGVVNAASYLTAAFPNYGIARGSIFLIFGTALGPQTLVSAAFPLPTTEGLAGTRVLLSIGGYNTACPILYTSGAQVAALMPSEAPEGDGQLVVSYQNLGSGSAPVHVVQSGFGIFTLNQAGTGPAVVQNFVSQASTPVNTLVTSAHPGQTVILWGTGLGPATGAETAGPIPGVLPFLDTLYVGGQPATVRYAGRSGCCAGVDQIVFDIPPGVTGCYVPVGIRTGGVIGNFGTISVSPAGNECDDPLSFRATDLTTLEQSGVLRTGEITLGRKFMSGGVPTELELAGVFLSYDTATLTKALWPLRPPAGTCYLSAARVTGDPGSLPHGAGLDAGTAVTVNGPAGLLAAPFVQAGRYLFQSAGNLPAGTYQFGDTGGADVGAFQVNATIGSGLQWTNAASFTTAPVSTAQPLTVTWSGGDTNGFVDIQVASNNSLYNATIQCTASGAAGSFTVPSYLMGTVFQSAGTITLTGVSAAAPLAATGLDKGAIKATSTFQVQANFQPPAQ